MTHAEIRPCTFCAPGDPDLSPLAVHGKSNLDKVPILETDNLVVYPDILPVSPDGLHMLLVPKTHGYSFATLPGMTWEVGNAIHRIEQLVGENLVIFEHGATKDGDNVQSVYHQHAHMVTSGGYDIIRYMSDQLTEEGIAFELIDTPDGSPVVNLRTRYKGLSYFYVQQGTQGLIAHDEKDAFPSQLTQRNMSKLLSGGELNWKKIPESAELAYLAAKRIRRSLERCRL